MVWLRLDRHFFEKPELKEIERMEGGKDYIIAYCLLLLIGGDRVPCDKDKLSRMSGIPPNNIERALNSFYKKGLVEIEKESDSPPSYEEVAAYAKEIKSGVDVKRFYEWYSASDFKYKGKPIDWKGKLVEWSEKERPKAKTNPFLSLIKENAVEHS